ncbi:MAG: GH116 family glycosyl hydrolase [Acidobacteriota bacterium]
MRHWRENYASLRERSAQFRDAFFDTTLPDEVVEAVAANLTILKSPTVRRQCDGRLWCFEGCGDTSGCCHGSCTHVWNYALGHEGGLLLCTWPKGGTPSLPFVYSNEVWTGIEYQVASHLMLEGMVEEGLEIVSTCRRRYDGTIRNPFNEYECGHWYARAMASYGLIQGLTGIRYDAVDKTLHIDSRVGDDFRAFLCVEGGFGTAGLKDGKPFVEIRSGRIEVRTIRVSGKSVSYPVARLYSNRAAARPRQVGE